MKSIQNKNFKTSRKPFYVFCFPIILLALLIYSQKANAAIIFQENWDSGTPPACWPTKTVPSSCCASPFNGWYGRSWDCNVDQGSDNDLSISIYHSAPRSMRFYRHDGHWYSTDLCKTIPEPRPTKIYVRFYAYFPSSSWNSWDQGTEAGNAMEHWFFMNTENRVPNRAYVDIKDYCGPYLGSPNWYTCYLPGDLHRAFFCPTKDAEDEALDPTGGDCGPCFNIFDYLNTWQSHEFMFDLDNNKYAHWVTLPGQATTQLVGTGGNGISVTYDPSTTDWYRVCMTVYRSVPTGVGAGPGEMYWDDIVVSDSYIGPMGAPPDTTPPAPPSGVTVN